MSEQRGKMYTCDRCGKQMFVKELSVEDKETDGGFTRWNEYKYEDLPDGWCVANIKADSFVSDTRLCPECHREYNEVISEFMGVTA